MKRRLYFLIPDTSNTRTIVNELEDSGIDRRGMHVIANDKVSIDHAIHRQQ
jgi:hypothetical protein